MPLAVALIFLLALVGCGGASMGSTPLSFVAPEPVYAQVSPGQYTNPLPIDLGSGAVAASCPDPAIIRGQKQGDEAWYVYCTNERFSDTDSVHLIPILRSTDLVHWSYVGDVFPSVPGWVGTGGGLWAPDIQFLNGKYYLYYTASKTTSGSSAIFVATSDTPTGPWQASPTPVVEPQTLPNIRPRDVIDPAVFEDNGQLYIVYGSFYGGIAGRRLSPDGMSSDPISEVQLAPSRRYEAPYVVKRDGYFYLFLSAGACCNGAMSGYGVFVGRSNQPLGPYVDRNDDALMQSRTGGTPVLAMSGNRWVGPGHNAVTTDATGKQWMVYHAIDANAPSFTGSWTRRPLMLDQLDWIDGWPTVRGGNGASDSPVVAPAVTPEQAGPQPTVAPPQERIGTLIRWASDEFSSSALNRRWRWTRFPQAGFGVAGGFFRFDSQPGDLYFGRNDVGVVTETAPAGNYVVEVKMSSTVPASGVFDYVQGGLVIYRDDMHYLKLVEVAIGDTRQVEFAYQKGVGNSSNYGSNYLSAPATATYLRIAKRITGDGSAIYTSYSSHDGLRWDRGGSWHTKLGANERIGLISMAGAGFSTYFDYVRVYNLTN